MSLFRRAGALFARFLAAPDDASPQLGMTTIYAKDNGGGVVVPYAIYSDGTVVQLGGGGGGGGEYAFVYQPGGSPGGNVYDNWNSLMTAMNAVAGPKLLQFDDQFNTILIPAGNYDMTDTIWEGVDRIGGGLITPVTVMFDNGATVSRLRTVRGLTLDCVGSPPILDISDGDVFILDDYSRIGGFSNPIIDLTTLPVFKFGGSATLCVRHGSKVLSQAPPITGLNTDGVLTIDVDSMSLFEGQTIQGSGGGLAILRRASTSDQNTALQDLLAGTIQVKNRIGGFNFQTNNNYQLFPGLVNSFSLGGAETANLTPAAWNPGGIFVVKKNSSTGTVTINTSGAETIDGNPTYVITAAYGSVIMVSDGVSNYMVIGEKS